MVFAKKGAPALKSAKIDSKRLLYGIVSECFRSPMYAEALSIALAVSLLREYSAAAAKPKRRPGELPRAKLVRAVQYIEDEIMSRITAGRMDPELESLASAYAMHPSIEAVVVSGSIGGALADELSDFDIYVYSKSPVEVEFRESLLRPRAAKLNLHRTFWEDEDAWIDATGTKFEVMYRSCSWIEGEIAARIEKHQACIGYTTAILYNVADSTIIFDRTGWFKSIQERLCGGFPVQLVRSIVAKNYPLLGDIISSYEEQIASAIRRNDTVSINHRVAAWLASYFDIIFAVNDRFHPGEKRLVSQMAELPDLPDGAIADVQIVLSMSASSHSKLSSQLADMREKTRRWLESWGLFTNA